MTMHQSWCTLLLLNTQRPCGACILSCQGAAVAGEGAGGKGMAEDLGAGLS
jgi:hypothetical protein